VKGHLSRQLKVSGKLIAMLNALPKTSTRIFPTSYRSMYTCFSHMRKRAAQRLQNPRLKAISFKTFRHWGGSLIAHYTHGNVLKVKKLLGHKRIESTMKYIHMMPFKDDEFDVAAATTIEEAKKLIAIGFEYITEMKGIKLFRKPKRFNV
jgi:integrase